MAGCLSRLFGSSQIPYRFGSTTDVLKKCCGMNTCKLEIGDGLKKKKKKERVCQKL